MSFAEGAAVGTAASFNLQAWLDSLCVVKITRGSADAGKSSRTAPVYQLRRGRRNDQLKLRVVVYPGSS